MTTLQTALDHAARGWYVFPCKPDKRPYWHEIDLPNGKDNASTEPVQIRIWWTRWPAALIGIYCAKSGLFALDVDIKDGRGGWKSLTELQQAHGGAEIAVGPIQQTPSGGTHLLFRLPANLDIPNNANKLAPGLDLRSNGYICTGGTYQWLPGHGPDIPLTAAPDWLLDLIRALRPPPKASGNLTLPPVGDSVQAGEYWLRYYLERAAVGQRNETGFALACQLRDSGLAEGEAHGLLSAYAAQVPGEGYSEQEAFASLRQAYRGARREAAHLPGISRNGTQPNPELDPPPAFPDDWDMPINAATTEGESVLLTESADHEGHARCVNALYVGKFAYSDRLGWLAYNGAYYSRENAELQVERAIVETLRARRLLAVNANLEYLIKATAGSRNNVVGTREQLRSLVKVSVEAFDAHPDELNVNNGVLNLRTGQLIPHDRTQKFTYCIPIDYDPAAPLGECLSFLQTAVNNNRELFAYIKLALGYTATGHTREEILFYLYGPTRSGKGTFTETLIKLFGGKPLSTEVDFQTFSASREGDTQNFDLAPLKPCRCVVASESNKNFPLNPAKIKQLTGGNYIYCAYKYHEHFSYRPQYKIWLSSNHPVNVDVDDEAAWARVQVIEFPISHLGNEDKTLKARLSEPANLRGLLRWIVEGAREWYALPEGLKPPESIQRITQTHRATQDFVQQFIDELCAVDPISWIHSGALYQAYASWCKVNGAPPKLQNMFSQALVKKGYTLTRKRNAAGNLFRAVVGLKLVTRDAPDAEIG